MPQQEEHDKPENLVESSQDLEKRAARTLEDAVDSNATLEGYYAMNDATEPEELEEPEKKRSKPVGAE